jgi:hypothetical protein
MFVFALLFRWKPFRFFGDVYHFTSCLGSIKSVHFSLTTIHNTNSDYSFSICLFSCVQTRLYIQKIMLFQRSNFRKPSFCLHFSKFLLLSFHFDVRTRNSEALYIINCVIKSCFSILPFTTFDLQYINIFFTTETWAFFQLLPKSSDSLNRMLSVYMVI